MELLFKIFGLPIVILQGAVIDDGGVENDGRGGKPSVQGSCVNNGFKGGTGLPAGLQGAVELALQKVLSSNHGPYISRRDLHGDEGSLGLWLLFQLQLQ